MTPRLAFALSAASFGAAIVATAIIKHRLIAVAEAAERPRPLPTDRLDLSQPSRGRGE